MQHNHAHSHSHAHPHTHGHGEHDAYVAQNQKHFDATAKEADINPQWLELARKISDAMLRVHPELFVKTRTELLDFACGTGTSASLLPRQKYHRLIHW